MPAPVSRTQNAWTSSRRVTKIHELGVESASADDAAVARPVETAVIQQQTATALTTPDATVAYQQIQGTTNTEGWLNNNLSLVDDKASKGKPTDSTTQTLSTDPSETPEPPPPKNA